MEDSPADVQIQQEEKTLEEELNNGYVWRKNN